MFFIYLFVAPLLASSIFAFPANTSNTTVEEGWDAFFSDNITSLLPLLHFNNKSYYFGFNFKTANYFQAAQFCEDIHMKLVSIESVEENDRLLKYIRDANKGDLFWTSGSNILDGKHWVWMSTGKPLEYTNWNAGSPKNEHCILAYFQKAVGLTWIDRDCFRATSFICEKRKESKAIEESSENRGWNSIFENPLMSINVALFHSKDKSFFLGRYFKATFQEALQLCQMMEMQLVTIESPEENDRIYKYIRDTNAGDSFWSSGTRMIDGTTWVWLSTGQIVDYTKWYTNQPDSATDFCIQLWNKDNNLFWTDTSCATRLSYICEKPKDKIIFDVRNAAKRRLYTSSIADVPLINMENGVYYLGTDFMITQLEASQLCQKHHLQLVSITTEEKNEEIRQLLLHYSASSNIFWTSAKKLPHSDNWTWSTGRPLNISNLLTIAKTDESANCIEINTNGVWEKQFCNEKNFFICEKNGGLASVSKSQPIINIYVNKNDSTTNSTNLPQSYFRNGNGGVETPFKFPDTY